MLANVPITAAADFATERERVWEQVDDLKYSKNIATTCVMKVKSYVCRNYRDLRYKELFCFLLPIKQANSWFCFLFVIICCFFLDDSYYVVKKYIKLELYLTTRYSMFKSKT